MRILSLAVALLAGCAGGDLSSLDGAPSELGADGADHEGRVPVLARAARPTRAPRPTSVPAPRSSAGSSLLPGDPRALTAFSALVGKHRRASSALAPDGSYLLLDARGRLHRVSGSGRSVAIALGAGAGRADGLATGDGVILWYRARPSRGRGWLPRYYRDLELHVSRDGGRSFETEVARLVVGNVGYVLRLERDGRLRLWTGAEFACGGGAYTRFEGRLGQDASAWERDDSLGGAEAFPEPPLHPRQSAL